MLLNARKRRKTRKASSRRRSVRRSTRRRRVTSAAASWMSAAGSKRSVRRRRARARRVTVKVRRLGKGSRRSAVVYVRANPRRRSYRRNPFRGGNLLGQVKDVFSKDNLTTAAGGVAATVLTNYLLNLKGSDGKSLIPAPEDPKMAQAVRLALAVGIPAVGAVLTKKSSPSLAKGMLIGGLINGITEAVRSYAPVEIKKILGMGESLQYAPTSSVGKLPPSYMAASRFASVRPTNGALDNSSAFPSDAWGN